MAKIGGGSPSAGYKLLHRIVRLGMSDRVIVSVSPSSLPPSLTLVTLFALPPFCETYPRATNHPSQSVVLILEQIYASTRAPRFYSAFSPRRATPLGVTGKVPSGIRIIRIYLSYARPPFPPRDAVVPGRRNEMSSNAIRYRRILIPLE